MEKTVFLEANGQTNAVLVARPAVVRYHTCDPGLCTLKKALVVIHSATFRCGTWKSKTAEHEGDASELFEQTQGRRARCVNGGNAGKAHPYCPLCTLYATPASKVIIDQSSRRGGRLEQDGASPPALEQPATVRSTARENTKGGRYVMSANAVAGAIAGTLVSICLHPVDTVKVTIQAERSAREPIAKVIARMLSKRGVFGLYSGLTTSLASSAPISAIYTASYESIKGKLLPMFPEEKKWVAHCLAGGCASVATSFVYTPSECIKQRCQVNGAVSAWAATRSIVATDGVFGVWDHRSRLYKGWTAVLCRNIPQSAIKFFVFEQLMRTACSRGSGSTTLPTLAIGGIAGSTAAVFTTPFDTIKTRLQTQGVGASQSQGARVVRGVIPTMKDIVLHEGVGGLYRGVIPRLFIYVTQGAVFFTSYEMARRALLGYSGRGDGAEESEEKTQT